MERDAYGWAATNVGYSQGYHSYSRSDPTQHWRSSNTRPKQSNEADADKAVTRLLEWADDVLAQMEESGQWGKRKRHVKDKHRTHSGTLHHHLTGNEDQFLARLQVAERRDELWQQQPKASTSPYAAAAPPQSYADYSVY